MQLCDWYIWCAQIPHEREQEKGRERERERERKQGIPPSKERERHTPLERERRILPFHVTIPAPGLGFRVQGPKLRHGSSGVPDSEAKLQGLGLGSRVRNSGFRGFRM